MMTAAVAAAREMPSPATLCCWRLRVRRSTSSPTTPTAVRRSLPLCAP
ncbi:UDP-N-acetylmuramoylalanine--D-glutamate ligase domain protein [Mycobacterium xenopi 3993]|nr:UDP-N-acetylmuramoylalanine--D-glutamate ligase domain protein [Mycobacterium xenopi 3993]